jgi:hypothetical protein
MMNEHGKRKRRKVYTPQKKQRSNPGALTEAGRAPAGPTNSTGPRVCPSYEPQGMGQTLAEKDTLDFVFFCFGCRLVSREVGLVHYDLSLNR